MAERFSFGNLEFTFGGSGAAAGRPGGPGGRPDPDVPLKIGVIGDFSGRASRGIVQTGDALAVRATPAVDVDEMDEVIGRLGVEVDVPTDSGPLTLAITEMDDLHPDRLYERLAMFTQLRQLREAAKDPATFAAAAAKVGGAPVAPTASASAQGESEFASLLGKRPAISGSGPAEAGAGKIDISSFIKQVVGSASVPSRDPRQAQLVTGIDSAISELMRSLLHHPAVQGIEAAWRGVHMLITSLETGEELAVHVIDVSRQELAADLGAATGKLQSSGLYKLLVEKAAKSPGVSPWGLLIANYSFGPTKDDAELLGRLTKVCAAAGAPLVAAAVSAHVGCGSFGLTPDPDHWTGEARAEDEAAWAALRALPEAEWAALALPRVLLRLPYGEGTEETERFKFAELAQAGGPPSLEGHEAYLWGNGALACAVALGRAFTEDGWDLDPELSDEVGGLPVHWKERGEVRAKPCAEAWLTDRAANTIRAAGLVPIQSIRGRDSVRVAGLQSIAGGALKGRWS
jgi:type VI secretion system protein ImpC